MNILALPSQYPYPGYPFCGIFNERSLGVLSNLNQSIEVLAPQPYVPPFFSLLSPRWKAYSTGVGYEIKNGIPVHRPTYLQLPRIGGAFCSDQVAFYCCRWMSKKMHRRKKFDAILSFDLTGTGMMAWRMGRYLGIPSVGWVTGLNPTCSSYQKRITHALCNFDMVFYQSQECFEEAASLLRIPPNQLAKDRHIVLARGIPNPPSLTRTEVRKRIREELGITDDQVLILNIGRVCQDKGIYELVDAMSLAGARNSKIRCVVVGSLPALDETMAVEKNLTNSQGLRPLVKILPACEPEKVSEYLCAADVFAFPSHHDGMPNALLEAMAMGIPAIAFDIPPIVEIESGRGGLLVVPRFNATLFSEAILNLASSPQQRSSIGEIGKTEVINRFMTNKNMAKALEYLRQVVSSARRGGEGITQSQQSMANGRLQLKTKK